MIREDLSNGWPELGKPVVDRTTLSGLKGHDRFLL